MAHSMDMENDFDRTIDTDEGLDFAPLVHCEECGAPILVEYAKCATCEEKD